MATLTKAKQYATRGIKRAEAYLAREEQDFIDGRALEIHVEKARQELAWAKRVRELLNTESVSTAYEQASREMRESR